MKAKTKIDIGLEKWKKSRQKNEPVAKRGGILPILSLLGVFDLLISGATGVAKMLIKP